MSTKDLLEHLQRRDAERQVHRWLAARHLADPLSDEDFALNSRTRRLRAPDAEHGLAAGLRPFALLLAMPDPPWALVVDPVRTDVWPWFQTMGNQGYPPEPSLPAFFRPPYKVRGMPGGLIAENDRHGTTGEIDNYFAVEQIGVAELGLTERVYRFSIAEPTQLFLGLTPLVVYVRQFLAVVRAVYQVFKQGQAFTFIVNLRGAGAAELTAFARDANPRSPECWVPHLQFRYPGVTSTTDFDELTFRIATEISNAWGQERALCYLQGDRSKGLNLAHSHNWF